MAVSNRSYKKIIFISASFLIAFAFSFALSESAFASRKDPKCRDKRSATSAVNRYNVYIARYQKKLADDTAWLNAANAACTNAAPAPTPTPRACPAGEAQACSEAGGCYNRNNDCECNNCS